MRPLIVGVLVAIFVVAVRRVIAVGRRQALGYRARREEAWGGMPKRYHVTHEGQKRA